MFRRGRGGCNGREGRRPERLLGHACVAIVLMVNAVATCIPPSTCTAPDSVITPRSCGLVLGHHHRLLPSVSHHSFWLPRSCLRPSRSVAAPELPVLEIAGQHRTCTVVTPTSKPGQREDVQTGASILAIPPTGQRVKYSASGALMHASILSIAQEGRDTAGFSLLFYPHIKNIAHRGRCYRAIAAGTLHLPLNDRGATRVSAGDSPCLKQPLLALDARDTDGRCYAASFLHLRCAQFGRATRVGQGQGVVGPTSAASRALRARRFAAFRGASHHERERRAADPTVAHKISTTALHYNDSHLSYWSSYFAVLPRLRLAAGLVTAVTEGWRGCLPPQVLRSLGRHCQSSLLHCNHHICTGFRQSLTSWVPPVTKCSTRGTLHTTPRPGYGGFTALHMRTTATPKHGSTSGSPHCCCRITSG